jgi:dipeptidyl aminopeptidase/acylaminoacyl peptidase
LENVITPPGWIVRSIESIDEKNRTITFSANNTDARQDPYFIHWFRIGMDGRNVVRLTESNGQHRVSFSPNSKFVVATWSRVDSPPIHELRNGDTGTLISVVESADIEEWKEFGIRMPEVFVAKGRDGETDIWGIVCRPREFDPTKKYPVIENIYAGPQDSFVPKTFSALLRMQEIAELGFIVVQIDGMGTRNRGKKFHDVCWQNIADAGFPDRVLWMKSLAEKYPYVDIDRVGVYGTSAGGQNAAGALLFQPDFYKVGVASCGCHDNRMDKFWWNEQWMGYPVGKHYDEQSNITNAWRLQGKLLLILGELDDNVPPESTLRLVDALVRANKDFDFLMIPNARHTDGGAYGERKRRDFFVRNLHGVEPPEWSAARIPR